MKNELLENKADFCVLDCFFALLNFEIFPDISTTRKKDDRIRGFFGLYQDANLLREDLVVRGNYTTRGLKRNYYRKWRY